MPPITRSAAAALEAHPLKTPRGRKRSSLSSSSPSDAPKLPPRRSPRKIARPASPRPPRPPAPPRAPSPARPTFLENGGPAAYARYYCSEFLLSNCNEYSWVNGARCRHCVEDSNEALDEYLDPASGTGDPPHLRAGELVDEKRGATVGVLIVAGGGGGAGVKPRSGAERAAKKRRLEDDTAEAELVARIEVESASATGSGRGQVTVEAAAGRRVVDASGGG